MRWSRLVLLLQATLLSLGIHPFGCDDQTVRNVKPIIGEIFDMLLESIEAKRRRDGSRDHAMLEDARARVDTREGELEQKRVLDRGEVASESRRDRLEVVDREISIQDGRVSLRLEIMANLAYGDRSVLVLKQWSEDYSEIGGDNGQLCSSSNISGAFVTRPARYREVRDLERSNLVFEMEQDLEKLEGRTFLLCLSDNIASNHSMYITKLSFSSNQRREAARGSLASSTKQGDQKTVSGLPGHYEFAEMRSGDYDQILVRTRVPSSQDCSSFVLTLMRDEGKSVSTGSLLFERKAAKEENLCFWSLALENSLFKDSDMLEIVQRHKSDGSSLTVSTVKFLSLGHAKGLAKTALSRSILFKMLLLILSTLPILLLTLGTYIVLLEAWTVVSSKISSKEKCLTSSTSMSNLYKHKAKSDEEKNPYKREKEGIASLRDLEKETAPTTLSSFNIVTNKSLNSEDSGLSSGENDHVIQDDPFRYFDSDCSISTHTGA
ncbi:putative signal peptide-containing protein [Cryptosporidium canis]|nr:putative signal peptide-containing protein [Cryptosporidium canis]